MKPEEKKTLKRLLMWIVLLLLGLLPRLKAVIAYRILWECLAKKICCPIVAQAGELSSGRTGDFRPIFAE